ncbi:unnamed protein product [Toxocara canis]|uniref:Uncharacterized protein n=1 Tax=Toxocara canis TaxID=6265 RepID=A0A183UVH0_TOXCA|nr:unnamed protein product [Toxocara canis]
MGVAVPRQTRVTECARQLFKISRANRSGSSSSGCGSGSGSSSGKGSGNIRGGNNSNNKSQGRQPLNVIWDRPTHTRSVSEQEVATADRLLEEQK